MRQRVTRITLVVALLAASTTAFADFRFYPLPPGAKPYGAQPYQWHRPTSPHRLPIAPAAPMVQPSALPVPDSELDDALRKELGEALEVLRKRPRARPAMTVGMSDTG
ncbi:MAG: hypothetical protein ACFCUJ_02970 [Thiotrichales bacterium]